MGLHHPDGSNVCGCFTSGVCKAASGPKTTLDRGDGPLSDDLSFLYRCKHRNKKWNNINVDMFIKKFPAVVQKVVSVLIKLSVLVFIIIIGYLGYKVFPSVGSRQMSATMNIPMLIPQLSIVIGCALMSLQLIGVLIREFYKGGEPNA